VTTIDGYRLARRGRAGAALAVAAIASFVAGTFSVVALQLAAPLVARAALAFAPRSISRSRCSARAAGQPHRRLTREVAGHGRPRHHALDGRHGPARWHRALHLRPRGSAGRLSFVAVTAGLFGVAEVLATMATPRRRRRRPRRFRELYPNREELRRSVPPMLRGTVLGFLVGLIPGPAATIASFVSYGVEKKISRHRDELGTGAIEAWPGPRPPTTRRRAAA